MSKNILFVCLFLVGVCHSSSGFCGSVEQQIKAIKKSEPSFSQILECYYKREQITNDHLTKLEKKAKVAPLLPQIYLGYDRSLKEDQGLATGDNISISGGEVTIGPDESDYDYSENVGQTVHVRAVWKLDELVFNRNMLLVAQERRDLSKLRSDLSGNLHKIYDQRYLSLLCYLQMKGSSPAKSQQYYVKYISLTEQLDALTGRAFHEEWWGRETIKNEELIINNGKEKL